MTAPSLTHALSFAPRPGPHPLRDSRTMLRRNLKRMLRYPSMTLMLVGMPVVFLLLFVFVFGATLGTGLAAGRHAGSGRAAYADYVTPAILVMTVASIVQGTSISVATDLGEGIIARFRTMNIARGAVLTGHVLGSMIQTMMSLAIVIGVAVLVGFRPGAGLLGWTAALGILLAAAFALTWLAVALGQASSSVETASNVGMPLILLPFLGSGFVPTDSMPVGLRWFAEYQPFTPVIDAARGLLMGTPTGDSPWIALGWCAATGFGGYLWSRRLYEREPAR